MRQVHGRGLVGFALMLAAVGCGGDRATCTGAACGPVAGSGPGQTSFESDLLDAQGPTRGAAGAAAVAAPTDSNGQDSSNAAEAGSGAAERAISEADIVQVRGDRLYALSKISGLAVIDVSQPNALKLLGRYRELPATPFEMYLQGDVALVMFSGWGEYVKDGDAYKWVTTSKLLALDVSDASKISALGSFDIPGVISDSRIVGDILYVVSRQDGYCWSCIQNRQLTAITSLRISDPHNVTKVDELDYDDGNVGWGPRSVTVTPQRMYVSGPMYGAPEPTESIVQVVDISDPAGDLVEGASVHVTGQVQSRWQMDEYQGVLRVVSQPWIWGAQDTRPAVQTFRVEASDKVTPLGHTEIQLPRSETLRSVRFDGPRAYAITALQTDPLFTLDLSDPHKPRQMGQLELPGFVSYMEPRGDRLLGLGFDQSNPAGAIAVSLFDVKDLSAPKLLSRVSFGGSWGSLPEDQDRLHKVFRVLDDAGLILVPFSGWAGKEQEKCGFLRFSGGVQLIDFQGDELHARGAAPSVDETRRALLVKDKLISVSDQRVQAFDIADRDKPAQLSQIVLSRNIRSALSLDNDVVARFALDNRASVDFVAKRDAGDANSSLAELALSDALLSDAASCNPGLDLFATFAHGSQLELLYSGFIYSEDLTSNYQQQGIAIIDVSKSDHPAVLSKLSWADADVSWSPYSAYYRYGYYGNVSAAVRTSSTISLLESAWVPSGKGDIYTEKTRLRVIDLRDPEHPKTTVLPLEAADDVQYSGLLADGDTVMTSHFEKTNSDGTRGRFYLDRFDLSDPGAPVALPKVNVPGALVSFDASSGRAITSEQVRVVADLTYDACTTRFASADWTSSQLSTGAGSAVVMSGGTGGGPATDAPIVQQPTGKCVGYQQRLHLVHVSANLATLEDTFALKDAQQVFSSSLGDGVLFASLGRGGYLAPRAFVSEGPCFGACGPGAPAQPTELLVLGGFASGKMTVGHLQVDDSRAADTWWGSWGTPNVYASGTRALLVGQSDVAIIDGSDPALPTITKRVPLIGSAQSVDVHADQALLALGAQGLQWIDLE